VFEADPAACPASSIVGTATVVTPMLAGALSGPAYLVSHGVLAFRRSCSCYRRWGEDRAGRTDEHPQGHYLEHVRGAADVPIDTLDLVLPTGPHSAFAVNLPPKTRGGCARRRCGMPTAITAQNGAQLKQTTRIGITGCHPPREAAAGEASQGCERVGRTERGKRAGRESGPGALSGKSGGDDWGKTSAAGDGLLTVLLACASPSRRRRRPTIRPATTPRSRTVR